MSTHNRQSQVSIRVTTQTRMELEKISRLENKAISVNVRTAIEKYKPNGKLKRNRPFRDTEGRTSYIQVRLDEKLLLKVSKIAEKHQTTISDVVRAALEEWLDKEITTLQKS